LDSYATTRRTGEMPKAHKATAASGRELLSWEEAAAYLGPSFSVEWLKRQVYQHRTIQAVRVGGVRQTGRTKIARAELHRYIDERMAQDGR
jgi:hypothetical protein